MKRCTECGLKPRQPNTLAYTVAKTNLWMMAYGWSLAMQRASKASNCNTCGVHIDRRRKFYQEKP